MVVANGSTLSTTGEMQVTCNVPYVLSVDGVEWSPVASAGGIDTYLLTTGGVVRIFIGGIRYFFFRNVLTTDFVASSITVQQFEGSTRLSSEIVVPYYQGVIHENATTVIVLLSERVTSPSLNREELIALGTTCRQGESVIRNVSWDEHLVEIVLRNFDATQYNTLYVGNVLLAFFEANS